MTAHYPLAAAVALLLLLCACSTPPPDSSGTGVSDAKPETSSRYAITQDIAPLRPIIAEDVVEAAPRPDPILAAGNLSPYSVNGVSYEVLEDHRNYKEQGIASWYGAKFDGHNTSNGERYDLYQASAAHKTLPIPCYVRVTNLNNGKDIVVRVNDRGPFHAERLIDLSYAAAVKLDYMAQGTARVEVEVINVVGVEDRRDVTYGIYRYLQLGAFGREKVAQTLQEKLQTLVSAPVFISPVDSGGGLLYRVRVGPVDDKEHFLAVREQLEAHGYSMGQPLP
ncbi:MAG: septal ring lytic transglycosylase RlpA family protein [Halioglobus sp.]|nr:septal ring lytic transglycosylase RlpA family protein [Halioglobus sp.]